MIFLFRKFNKQIIATEGAQAWEAFKSNGDWKYRPIFLGAVTEEAFKAIGTTVRELLPISADLTTRVNTGEDKVADREMQKLIAARSKMERELLEQLALTADTTKTPRNMDIVNNDSLPPEYQKMARNMRGDE